MDKLIRWSYDVLQEYRKSKLGRLLFKDDLVNSYPEMVRVDDYEDPSYNGEKIGYFLSKDNELFFVDKKVLKDLPIYANQIKKDMLYNKKVFNYVVKYVPYVPKEDKVFSFRELMDLITPFENTSSLSFTLWKIIVISAICDRIFIRVSTNPGFGKDSVANAMSYITNGVVVHTPKSESSIKKRLSRGGAYFMNELCNLDKASLREISDMLLNLGDGKNTYENSKRGISKYQTEDVMDITGMSMVLMFNRIEDYSEGNFFDDMITNKAILERYLPMRFDGDLDTSPFEEHVDSVKIASDNFDFFRDVINSVQYYKNKKNVLSELKDFKQNKPKLKHNRYKKSYGCISNFCNLWANNQEEYDMIIDKLNECITNYYVSIGYQEAEHPKGVEEIDFTT